MSNIAILGWGSLLWRPESLAMTSAWNPDGPLLPLEFARLSGNNTLTLVIHPASPPQQTYWVTSACPSVADARENLGKREGCPAVEPDSCIDAYRRNASAQLPQRLDPSSPLGWQHIKDSMRSSGPDSSRTGTVADLPERMPSPICATSKSQPYQRRGGMPTELPRRSNHLFGPRFVRRSDGAMSLSIRGRSADKERAWPWLGSMRRISDRPLSACRSEQILAIDRRINIK